MVWDRKAWARKNYAENKEKFRLKRLLFWKKHSERLKENSRERYQKNKAEGKTKKWQRSYYLRNKEYFKRYRDEWRKKNPEKQKAIEKARREREPDEKRQAVWRVNHAIKKGRMSVPTQCEKCGTKVGLTKHHPDYSKPFFVKVLCYDCHADLHRNLRLGI